MSFEMCQLDMLGMVRFRSFVSGVDRSRRAKFRTTINTHGAQSGHYQVLVWLEISNLVGVGSQRWTGNIFAVGQ